MIMATNQSVGNGASVIHEARDIQSLNLSHSLSLVMRHIPTTSSTTINFPRSRTIPCNTSTPQVADLRNELAVYLGACMRWIYLFSLVLLIASTYNCLSGSTSVAEFLKISQIPACFLFLTCQAAQNFSDKVA